MPERPRLVTAEELERSKVDEYLARGVPLVVVIDPDDRTATLSRPSAVPIILQAGELLDLNDVVPGFQCRVRDIFE